MDQSNRCDPRGQRRRTFLPLLPVLLLTSCAAAPFLIPAGIEFARNLLFTSNKNYGSKYSEDMNRLLLRLSTPYVAMGLPPGSSPAALMPPAMLQQQQQQQQQMMAGQMQGQPMVPGQPGMYGGYDPYNSGGAAIPGTGYPQTGYGQQQPYAQQGNPYGTMPGNQAQPGGYYDPNNPYGGPNVSIQAPAYQGMNPYGGQYGGAAMGGYPAQPGFGMPGQPGFQGQPGYPPPQPGYPALAPGSTMQGNMPGYQQQPMQGYPQQSVQAYQPGAMQQGYGYPGQQPPNVGVGYPGGMYQGGVYPRSVPSPSEFVSLDVALIRQVNKPDGKQVVLIQDGDVLTGGHNGDHFKLVLRTNCECFVYIVSVDGSGWAQAVFPAPNGKVMNPVKPDVELSFPEGPYWFTLDQYRGVETFYLVASPARRTDLEEVLAQMNDQQRPSAPGTSAQVEEPAIIPNGFGKMQPAVQPTMVRSDSTQAIPVTPLTYVAEKVGEDVRVTRWFKHE